MRLMQVCTNFLAGGIQRHVLELTETLRSRGHVVFPAGTPGPWLDRQRDEQFLPLDLGGVSAAGGHILSRLQSMLPAVRRLRRFVAEQSIELIHAHESAPLLVARLATIGKGIPVLVTYHGSAPDRIRYFGKMCRAARLVITPSHACAKELFQLGGVPEAKLRVIGLGVRPAPEIPADRVNAFRRHLLGPQGTRLVVTIARLAYQKGIDVLVRVVRETIKHRKDIRFVLVGSGEAEARLQDWIAAAGIGPYFHYAGPTDEPHLYLQAADLFLLTSRWEALPITIAEAFQSGLPVVATDTGGVRELVSESVGRVRSVGDAGGLAASVLEICSDDALRASLSENALMSSREDRFSLTHAHQALERTYFEALGMPPAGADG